MYGEFALSIHTLVLVNSTYKADLSITFINFALANVFFFLSVGGINYFKLLIFLSFAFVVSLVKISFKKKDIDCPSTSK